MFPKNNFNPLYLLESREKISLKFQLCTSINVFFWKEEHQVSCISKLNYSVKHIFGMNSEISTYINDDINVTPDTLFMSFVSAFVSDVTSPFDISVSCIGQIPGL